jgi:hypothetical protein
MGSPGLFMSTNLPAGGWIVVPNSHVEGPAFAGLPGTKSAHLNRRAKVAAQRGECQSKSNAIRGFALDAINSGAAQTG